MSILSRIKSGWHTLLHKLGLVTKAEEAAAYERGKEEAMKVAQKMLKKQLEKRQELRDMAREAAKAKKKFQPGKDELDAAGYE